MKVITTYEEYIEKAIELIKNQTGLIRISSFNLYSKKDSITEEFLKEVSKYESNIIIGTSYSECTPGCQHCINKNINRSTNLQTFIRTNSIKVASELHLKYISRGSLAITGGMNLTGSGYSDMAVLINKSSKVKEMNEHFDTIYNQCTSNYLYANVNRIFTFGKHLGKTVEQVRQVDPDYITWASRNLTPTLKNTLGLD